MTAVSTETSSAAAAAQLLSTDEACLFEALTGNLPEGWVVEFKADTEMAWTALVYCEDAPRSRPLFSVCRWSDHMGLFVQWMDGSAASATVFTELSPVLALIPSGIFACAEARLATVPPTSWADTSH